MLSSWILQELPDVPLYYEYGQLMHVVKSAVPKAIDCRSALLNAGYRCSISHCNPNAIKTDAPMSFIWDIARTVVIFAYRFHFILSHAIQF